MAEQVDATATPAKGATVDVTAAPAKIVAMTELKNGNVYVATEAKLYQLLDGKLRPVTFADVEHETVMGGSQTTAPGAVPSAAPPPVPPKKPDAPPPPPPNPPPSKSE
jgi:hypothetical protein